jgi:hypothetical protein
VVPTDTLYKVKLPSKSVVVPLVVSFIIIVAPIIGEFVLWSKIIPLKSPWAERDVTQRNKKKVITLLNMFIWILMVFYFYKFKWVN